MAADEALEGNYGGEQFNEVAETIVVTAQKGADTNGAGLSNRGGSGLSIAAQLGMLTLGIAAADGPEPGPADAVALSTLMVAGGILGGALLYEKAVHGNSANSMRGTEVYYLINNSTGAIDKIGITSNPAGRYTQAYLRMENVFYETQARYDWRYAAMVDENIRLTFYQFEHGELPRLNKVTR